MRRHAVHHTYTGLLSLIAAGLLALAFAACNGNGGSMDSGGAVYNPNGTASGGSGGSSGSGGTTETFTAQDLLNRSNAGDDSGIVHLVTGGGTSPNSKTVTMSAADLGLPADGTGDTRQRHRHWLVLLRLHKPERHHHHKRTHHRGDQLCTCLRWR